MAFSQPEPFATVALDHSVYRDLSAAGCEGTATPLTRYEIALRTAKRLAELRGQGRALTDTEVAAFRRLAAELRNELAQLGVDLAEVASLGTAQPAPPAPDLPLRHDFQGPPPSPALNGLNGFGVGFEMAEDGLPSLALELNPNRPSAWRLDLGGVGGVSEQPGAGGQSAGGTLAYQPGGLALQTYLGGAGISARIETPETAGLSMGSADASRPDYSVGARVPLGFAHGELGTTYARVTDLFGTGRDSVVTTDLDLELMGGLSLSASLARAGHNPFAGEASWRAEASISPGSFTVGAGVIGIDPDFVRLGYLGPTPFSTPQPLRGVAGSVTYQRGDSLRLHGGIESYGLESDTESLFRRYLAGVGYSLNELLALDFSLARLETVGDGDLSSTYATLGLGLSFAPDVNLKLLYRVLDLQNDTAPSTATTSSVIATEFSVRF